MLRSRAGYSRPVVLRGCGKLCILAVVVAMLGVSGLSSWALAADPRIGKLRFVPELPQTGDSLKIRVGLSKDASRAQVTWFLNGEEAQRSDIDRFSSTADFHGSIKARDEIKVVVKPYGELGEEGDPSSRTVVCQNAPPDLRLVGQDLKDGAYVARVEAEDPEGRPVSFALREGPPGMEIDDQGHIRWQMPDDASGGFTVKVAAKDEDGGEAVLSYTFTVRRSR
jgi:hypothetical protein